MSLAHGTMPSILLVEDDPISALFLSAALEGLPANVQVAADCAQARAASGPFDAWLIDANLPDGSGAVLLQQLRAFACCLANFATLRYTEPWPHNRTRLVIGPTPWPSPPGQSGVAHCSVSRRAKYFKRNWT